MNGPQPSQVGVLKGDDGDRRAAALAAETGLPLVVEAPPDGCVLSFADSGLELRTGRDRPGRGVRLDGEWLRHELRAGGARRLRRDPLARAVGAAPALVADATAGLGQDAMLLAVLGHRVVAMERHVVLWTLLRDGLERLRADELLGEAARRIDLRLGDAAALLPQLDPPPTVVVLDPMFPSPRKRSALPPKPAQILRMVVGPDLDSHLLMDAALAAATRRVVVKRPDGAPPLRPGRVAAVAGKTVRYDVYAVVRGARPAEPGA